MPAPCPSCQSEAEPVTLSCKRPHTGCSNDDCILGRKLFPLEKWEQRGTPVKEANFAISQQVAGMIEAAHACCPVSGYVIRDEQSRQELIAYARSRAEDIEHYAVKKSEAIAMGTAIHEILLRDVEPSWAVKMTANTLH